MLKSKELSVATYYFFDSSIAMLITTEENE